MIEPKAVPTLWKIAHDRTEIPAGEFLEELAALPISMDGAGIKITQQTLSNYVRLGFVPRERIATAPGGRGQTGYFQRRALIHAIHAHDFLASPEWTFEDFARFTSDADDGQVNQPDMAVDLLSWRLHRDYYRSGEFRGSLGPTWLPSEHDDAANNFVLRAEFIVYLSRLLEAVPQDRDGLKKFAPDPKGRAALRKLRSQLKRALVAPVRDPDDISLRQADGRPDWDRLLLLPDWDPLDDWLNSTPGDVT